MIRTLVGNWEQKHRDAVKQYGVELPEFGLLDVREDGNYERIIEILKEAQNFSDRRRRLYFETNELNDSNKYLLVGSYPDIVYSQDKIKTSNFEGDYLHYAFGEICSSCNSIPKGEQLRPITLSKEPKLPKKYLWGGFYGVSGYLFTDHERYKLLHSQWGLKKREVLIGKNQRISENFVQVEIPISPSPLCFGNADFANTYRLDGSGEIDNTTHICSECKRPLYTNQLLDYFPDFQQKVGDDIVFTQEWFGWFRRPVISRKFAQWLHENKFIKWNSDFIFPVKNFCS